MKWPYRIGGMPVQLTDRDERIIWTLTRKLRVVTVDQAARTWWSDRQHATKAARDRLSKLRHDGLLHLVPVMAHPEIELPGPVFCWEPGDDTPDFGPISYRLRSRWNHPVAATTLVGATRQAVREFGGFIADRLPRPSEASHDIHLAQVYLKLVGRDPALAHRWICEQQLYAEGRGRNERLPDAILRPRRGKAEDGRVIEFGGAYTKKKLEEFHEGISHSAYEIW